MKNTSITNNITFENNKKLKNKIEKLLIAYRKIDFYISDRLESIVEYLNQVDLNNVKNIIIIFNIDLEDDIDDIKKEQFKNNNYTLYLKIMDVTLAKLDKYPDKGKVYAEIIRLKYFEKEKHCNERISEIICVSRSTYYRYLKQANIAFGEILFNYIIPEIESMLQENEVDKN
ncbi:hypothetical protein [Anaerosphaera multitolerans]|uniref:DUF1492 domain-containing protein n=1 Tax=Anaerosphaera multitolerans TaxID=2487351 RepID=A0A437S9E5_9FIRM|nr:hypothetical protein [Anaerosphaera multitolerans]RVU55448.1 hypothetical protein EF514_01590 [Anaerosphaera multitolerans]